MSIRPTGHRRRDARYPAAFAALLLAALPLACGAPETGEESEAGRAAEGEAPAAEVRAAIEEAIHARGDTLTLGFADRRSDERFRLAFDHVHEGVEATPGGRYVACVDFRGADGALYDVDYYVARDGDDLRIEDAVLHEVAGENVVPDSTRARLESQGSG